MAKRVTAEQSPISSSWSAIWTRTLPIVLLLGIIALGIENRLKAKLLRDRQHSAIAELVPYGNSLGNAVERRLAKLNALYGYGLKGLSPDGKLEGEEFDSYASGLASSIEGVHKLSIAPAGVQSFLFPLDLNRADLGVDFMVSDAAGDRESILSAIESGQTVLETSGNETSPEWWLTAWRPLVRNGDFLGVVIVEFDMRPIFEEAGLIPPPENLAIAVRDESGTLIHGSGDVLASKPVSYHLGLSQCPWDVLGIPADGWIGAIRPTLIGFRIAVALVTGLLGLLACLISNRHRLLSDEIAIRTRELSGANDELVRQIEERKEAEAALRESEERLERTRAFSLVMVAHVSLEGTWTKVPETFCDLLGYASGELLGRTVRDVTHPDDVRFDLEQSRALIEGRAKTYDIEMRFVRKDGQNVWVYVNRSIVTDRDGNPLHFLLFLRNITEEKAASEALRESQERYRRIVETAGEGIWVVDQDWKTTFVNARMGEMLGYSAEEMLGRPAAEFAFPTDRPALESRMRVRERGISEPYQFSFQRKDGTELCALVSTSAMMDEAGQFAGSLGMLTDISDRVMAERTLQENERRLATLMANLPGMAYRGRVDAGWTMEFVSEGCLELTGYKPSELSGQSATRTYPDLIHPEDLPTVTRMVATAFRNRDFFRQEYRIRTASGAVRWVWEQGMAIYSAEGVPVAIEGFVTDITDRREAEEEIRQLNDDLELRVAERSRQLSEANRELESFTYSVSHDLRAPLRGIDGFARILEEDYAGSLDPAGQRYLSMVRRNAQQMGQLIDDLLNFSRLNRQSLTREAVNVKQLVAEVDETIRQEEASRDIELVVADLPMAEADPPLLRQVFVNLLSNAYKFTRGRERARIEVGYRDDPDEGTVYFVKDNGVGFDMKYKDKLFGVFQRLHRAEDYEGTGVGLALIHRIVLRHGGRIWAEAALDEGATFYFTLGEDSEDE